MQELAIKWLDAQVSTVNATISQLGQYKERNGLSKISNLPITNILMFPRTRTERRFIVPFMEKEDGTPYYLTPQEAQDFVEIVLSKLNETYTTQGEFSIRRNQEFAIFIKFTERPHGGD
jgi:hypothetical protein